jgi:hypothetical protein
MKKNMKQAIFGCMMAFIAIFAFVPPANSQVEGGELPGFGISCGTRDVNVSVSIGPIEIGVTVRIVTCDNGFTDAYIL